MTELELLEMLSGVQSSYIQQADAFREGRLRIVRKKRPVVTALKILSVAAMFVLILGVGYFGLQNLAAKQASEKASETMAAQSGTMADAEDWQRMVLRDGIRFYNGDFANSYNSYTVSEFCGVLAKWMGTEEAPKPARYAKLDMDGDGLEELVVELEGTGDLPRLVLGSFDGQILGEIYYERQMSQLKAGGVFYTSGGIGNRSWARLQRSADGWTVEDLEGDYTDEPDAVWTQWVSLGTAEVTNGNSDTTEVTPELLGRDASCNLTVWQGADKYPVAADLFIGDGYSLYIPREGWVHEVIDYHGTTADRWVCADQTLEEFSLNSMLDTTNREALRKFYDQQYPTRLTVLFRPGMDDQAIRDWVIEANPDWDVTQNARGELFADGATVEFFRTETGVFICIMETPAFGTGGAGRSWHNVRLLRRLAQWDFRISDGCQRSGRGDHIHDEPLHRGRAALGRVSGGLPALPDLWLLHLYSKGGRCLPECRWGSSLWRLCRVHLDVREKCERLVCCGEAGHHEF